MWVVWCAVAAAALAARAEDVVVERLPLALGEDHELTVERSREFILQFVPTAEQKEYPLRVRVNSEGGDTARPLLITARQRSGAVTWQLPYRTGEALQFELERALCPPTLLAAPSRDDCDSEVGGELSLHVSSSCSAPVRVRVRVWPDTDWRLSRPAPLNVTLTMARPALLYYEFGAEEEAVRLVLAAEDDVCARVGVQAAGCPAPHEPSETAARMTVQRAGAATLARARLGPAFYVVAIITDSDEACSGEPPDSSQWLWEDALGARDSSAAAERPPRVKRLSLRVEATLGRRRYWAGAAVTLAVFLAFYVAFGAFALLERWPPWRRLVEPRAVLAEPACEAPPTDAGGGGPRRASDATFDGSDVSDTESEGEAAPAAAAAPAGGEAQGAVEGAAERRAEGAASEGEGGARPFGLPAVLRVQALSRRRERVLRARSARYLYALATVAVFYALPVAQFVAAFQVMFNVSGSLDLCYYNFLCAHPLGALADFNHVLSNAGYLLLGALLLLQLRRRRARRRARPRHPDYGLPPHHGLLASLGAGMMAVALLSAGYHVCPNRLNFQFDTAFMYVLAVLTMVAVYQARHADINARAHATFAVLAALMALVVWGVLDGGALFWAVLTVVHVFAFLLLSLQIYYLGQFRLEKASLVASARSLRPLYGARLAALVLANAANWAFALYGLALQPRDVASHLLGVLLSNALLYMVFYLAMKLAHGERVRWYAWLHLAGAAAAWAAALAFFVSGSTDWAATPAQSRHLNHECRVLSFYDSHDLWHALSAVALYLTFNAVLTWDDGLAAVPRKDIPVF